VGEAGGGALALDRGLEQRKAGLGRHRRDHAADEAGRHPAVGVEQEHQLEALA
jgi:hypothetical protein